MKHAMKFIAEHTKEVIEEVWWVVESLFVGSLLWLVEYCPPFFVCFKRQTRDGILSKFVRIGL